MLNPGAHSKKKSKQKTRVYSRSTENHRSNFRGKSAWNDLSASRTITIKSNNSMYQTLWLILYTHQLRTESLWSLMYRWRSWSSEMEAPWPQYTLGLCLCDYRPSSPQGFHCHWVGFWWSRSGFPFLKGNWASGGEKMGITPGSPCTLLFIHIKGCPRHG